MMAGGDRSRLHEILSTLLQVDATRALSQALSSGLPSPAHALSISAAPAAVAHMDLAATSASLTQPAASSASAGTLPPAIAAQQTHLSNDADSHPAPSPNYRMDHVLADSLHAGMHASHDFGPMSLTSAMSNDENLTPAASRGLIQAAGEVAQEDDAVGEVEPQVRSPSYGMHSYTYVAKGRVKCFTELSRLKS